MEYLHWNEKTITDFSENNITDLYNQGYVFTRIGRGIMHQTRSVRIDLSQFELSSENRRILRKINGDKNATLTHLESTPLPLADYSWYLGKLAKDFYESKFGPGIMSSKKIKEVLTDSNKSNFNSLLEYTQSEVFIGATIAYSNRDILHYSYPFYDLSAASKDMGLGMMIMAINHAKEDDMKYVYLGSLQRPTDTYKLQFAGLEWFDGAKWSNDLEEVKDILVKK
ncbi:MAG: hypothetical protein PHG25_00820 [Candidatus Pacebacteria bacterium]|nr:hypothetical protein [Candidatus Paceibacterota bacterium]